jgi:ferrous iron transport protein B
VSLTIGLVGNPNCGKTTLFNALTGARQKVGNWSGVTVERKSGFFKQDDATIEVVDLPGTYSLIRATESLSIDESIACEFILNRQADVIINIIDASNLERNLYLTMQLIEMRVPMMVVLNMMDVAKQRGIQIDLEKLEKELGCPVMALQASKRKGIKEFKRAILAAKQLRAPQREIPCSPVITKAIHDVMTASHPLAQNKWLAIRLLEDDAIARAQVNEAVLKEVAIAQGHIRAALSEDPDILLADARYQFIQTILTQAVKKTHARKTWTARLDAIVLNRLLGIPIFLAVMYWMFFFAINIGGAFQDFFDISSDTLFVDGFAHVLGYLGSPNWLTAILANGIGKGINTTITFMPVIGAMFLALAFLEDSGYMARAAFVVDRAMRALGLPGKSFVPMIVGFGCNVPSVMAARTLENKRDRILTAMMSPFMSCGARLAIYAIFTAAFFSSGGQNIVFMLYLLGIIMAMLTGLLLRKTVLKGEPASLVMELPPYHLPNIKTLCIHAWQRLKLFVLRAGKLIIPICVLIGVLNVLNMDGTINSGGDSQSLLSTLGQWLTPIFAPMGIHQDNWPATVGLVTGVLAKEVVVGTLNTLYSQIGHLTSMPEEAFNVWAGLSSALASIPENLMQLVHSLSNPILAKAPIHPVTEGVYGVMASRFDGRIGAVAYLLFVLLYFPCVSTTAAMLREVNRAWTWFSVVWTTLIAYGVAVGFYQAATFLRHPVASALWLGGILGTFFLVVFIMRQWAARTHSLKGKSHELARN